MPEQQTLTRTRVNGEIAKILYENTENGFAIISVRLADGSRITAKGLLGGIGEGQFIEADGYFEDHPDFGRQFRMDMCRVAHPTTREGITRYLQNAVFGIGPKTAAAIVEKFGAETVTILDLYPRRLLEVKKIGKNKAEKIIRSWKESKSNREDMIFLQGLGITPAYCSKLFKQYGSDAVKVVKSNPYRLAQDVDGIGFIKADAIASGLGFAPDSVDRMQAAVVFSLNEMIGSGHVCAPVEELVSAASRLTSQTPEAVRKGVDTALDRRLLCMMDNCIYTPFTARAEVTLPMLTAKLASVKNFAGEKLRKVKPADALQLDELQKNAVEAVFERPLNIITGGPGVGKTTVIGEIVRRAKAARLKIQLAAPTGRAAKRMSESCMCAAKTIHRLLMFDPVTAKFSCNSSNPLDCEILIVDEVSMLDILLASSLFSAVPQGCSVILVGDSDQLPSVGPGNVLADFIESGFFGVTRLTKIFRQSSNSGIITNAHLVNAGKFPRKVPLAQGELGDFYWIEQDDPEKVASMICTLVGERIPERFDFDPMNDIQVLSPMNRGECGTTALNQRLSDLLHDETVRSFQFGKSTYKLGDRVMQTVNNYDKNVFNGDMGKIIRMDCAARKFHVCFDEDHFVEYSFDEAGQLTLAYAVTIHKSQGSEFPAVVMPILTQHFVMLQRNLLYTGMTRAKKLLVLIGSAKAVEIAVRNTRKKRRFSNLLSRLHAEKEHLANGKKLF